MGTTDKAMLKADELINAFIQYCADQDINPLNSAVVLNDATTRLTGAAMVLTIGGTPHLEAVNIMIARTLVGALQAGINETLAAIGVNESLDLEANMLRTADDKDNCLCPKCVERRAEEKREPAIH